MRVALADDSTLFRRGLAALLRASDVDVICEARTATELLDCIDLDPPDVAILDIRMPPTFTEEGIAAAEQLQQTHPAVGILLLSTYTQTQYALRLLANGSAGRGYLLKDRVDDVSTLRAALDRLARRESVVDPDIVTRLLTRHDRQHKLTALTDREREVLQLMAEGRSNTGISEQLFLSVKTVEAHAATVFTKLGLHAAPRDNRRVLAVLTWLRSSTDTDNPTR
jgi:DNA-binding NarL/FixJ family response regulator